VYYRFYSDQNRKLWEESEVSPDAIHQDVESGLFYVVISGKYCLRIDDQEDILVAGDSYLIPANVSHGIEVIEAGEVVDVFTPPREDYLE
jgi:quercetin dioxygenase-like cupin family protein